MNPVAVFFVAWIICIVGASAMRWKNAGAIGLGGGFLFAIFAMFASNKVAPEDPVMFAILAALAGLVVVLCVLLQKLIKESTQWLRSYYAKKRSNRFVAETVRRSPTEFWRARPQHNNSLQEARRSTLPKSNNPWLDHCVAIENAWSRGDYDWARQQLQKIAYGMVGGTVTDTQRADFTKLMTEFAKEDPLYREVMDRTIPLIQSNPGILQSKIYKGQPEHIKEQMRYVLYFANELGHIKRSKKGNSYQLTLPDDECTESTLRDVTNLKNIDRRSQYVANHPSHTNDAMWFYKTAYYHVMKSIVADVKQIDAMLPDLMSTFEQGNKRRVRQIFSRYLPDGAWNWPAYEEQLVEWKKSIPAYIPDGESEDDEIDYDDMIDRLCARIDMTAYALRRKNELKDSIKEKGGKWMFVTLDNIFTPSDCKKRNGMLFDHDDPILDNFPPCENIMCGCRLTFVH